MTDLFLLSQAAILRGAPAMPSWLILWRRLVMSAAIARNPTIALVPPPSRLAYLRPFSYFYLPRRPCWDARCGARSLSSKRRPLSPS